MSRISWTPGSGFPSSKIEDGSLAEVRVMVSRSSGKREDLIGE